MFKNLIFAVFSFFALSVPSFSQAFSLNSAALPELPAVKAPLPYGPTPVTPPGVTIATYSTDETASVSPSIASAISSGASNMYFRKKISCTAFSRRAAGRA